MNKAPPYPFVKWAGGKARLARHIVSRLPDEIGTYYEPLLGGGAVFFELARAKRFKRAVLNDLNPDLMNAWTVVRDKVEDLVKELRKRRYRYDRDAYMAVRGADPESLDPVRRAARFIYLNRTCFNGLYRVNKEGRFNVPFGRYDDPIICDARNLRAVSETLLGVELKRADFVQAVSDAERGDAVYFDPPYVPTSETSDFTGYTEEGFGMEDHERLRDAMVKLSGRGVRVVVSNSCADGSIALFGKFDYDVLSGRRNVGGPAEYRRQVGEIVAFAGPRSWQ